MTWQLTNDGILLGSPNYLIFQQNDGIYQINNPVPHERWKRYLPIKINQNGKSVTELHYFTSSDTSEDFYWYLELLDPITREVLSQLNLRSEYEINKQAEPCIYIPSHLLLFKNKEPDDIPSKRYEDYMQFSNGDYNKTWTNLVFLENNSNDPMEWKKQTFDYYPPGDAHLLCWEYSPDHQGCFLLFEVYPGECNELIYYNTAKHEVMAKVQIQGYREGFQVFCILNDRKTIMVYSKNTIEFYSLPDLRLLKTVSHPKLEINSLDPITATTDLQYIAYGRWHINILDTTTSEFFVLDKRHYDRINLSFIVSSKGRPNYTAMANYQYEMQQLCFFKDEHILTGLTHNGQYFQWDVDQRKRIVYKDLAVVPK